MSSVRYPDMIAAKRDGRTLTDEQLVAFVRGVATRDMADAQIGAMLMAIYLKGLDTREVTTLTREMTSSGDVLSWPAAWKDTLVDKHSTGGVGDKVSLVLMPALAAVGMKVPTISGRGLGHTGGTLDKLEAIPGFNVSLTAEEMTSLLDTVGVFIAGQTKNICPSDKIMYMLRDVTSTVGHVGLITGSIMSKKLAESVSALVLDVKYGSGAMCREEARAEELAHSMVSCGKCLGLNSVALLTDMDSPIGNMVGNALEVAETVWCLQGRGPEDLTLLCVELGGQLMHAAGHADSAQAASVSLRAAIEDGRALRVFREMLKGQGVSADVADALCDPQADVWTTLTPAQRKTELKAPSAGSVRRVDAMDVAVAVHRLGGGRTQPGAAVNWAVGVQLLVGIGDTVTQGQPWAVIHHDDDVTDDVTALLTGALEVTSDPVTKRPSRVKKVITE